MKTIAIILNCLIILLASCQKPQQSNRLPIEIKNGTGFPKELAGTWRCAQTWEIMIEEDGTVSWVLYPMGGVWMEPAKKVIEVPMRLDKTSTYVLGDWKASYDHKTSIFSIDIIVPYFEIVMGDDSLTGNSTDLFYGPMDPNGTWNAEWISTATYIVNTKEYPDHPLDTNDDPNKGTIIFKRFDVKY